MVSPGLPAPRRPGASAVAYCIIAVAILTLGFVRWAKEPGVPSGFNVVWCAGHALLDRRDPYDQEPIHSCERALGTARGAAAYPAPQPPYALVLFALVALPPHDVALAFWEIAAILAVGVVAWALARIAGMPLWAAAAAIAVPMLVPTSKVMSLPPMALTLVVLAALALRYERTILAVILLALGCVQIDIAAPALVALFVALPKARVPVAACAVALVAASLLAGPALCLEWLAHVVPAQAAAEASSPLQFSLAALLAATGVAEPVARAVGSVQSLLFIAFGIVAAAVLYRRDRNAAWLVLLPAGFSAVGGVYVHAEELAFAIPPLALLASQRGAMWAKSGLIVLCAPWYWAASVPDAIVLATAGPFLLLRWAFRTPVWLGVLAVAAIWSGLGALHDYLNAARAAVAVHPAALAAMSPSAVASLGWGSFQNTLPNPPVLWIAKLPSLIGGLLLLPATCIALTRPKDPQPANAPPAFDYAPSV